MEHVSTTSATALAPAPVHSVLPATSLQVFSQARTPITDAERENPPRVEIVDAADGGPPYARIEPEDARAVLRVECQIHIDMVYIVTRDQHGELVLWRLEHAGLAPASLSNDMKQRMLSAPGAIKRWSTGDYRIHELEPFGRHDMQAALLIFEAAPSGLPEAETYISLGTTELSDSDWLRNWIVVLDNGRRVTSSAAEYDSTRIIRL